MKQADRNEEALYNKFLSELEEGAREYDRMMAAGEAPSQQQVRRSRIIAWRPYAVAASIAILIIGGIGLYHADMQKQAIMEQQLAEMFDNGDYSVDAQMMDVLN